eukprot:CAMPEP_0115712736 /NCGR_PEP_ID=MMETSP0272-20121206/74289_1 /TAXON_ID=71861 /ORGANISM="Scrippsiella trochoidea, Strain CCMP3099" /LENGTH=312 /DNA_ID=CAMNT_0003154683 /DNA_START=36 /DNA_END=971 /DNA_ORIENTATION=-
MMKVEAVQMDLEAAEHYFASFMEQLLNSEASEEERLSQTILGMAVLLDAAGRAGNETGVRHYFREGDTISRKLGPRANATASFYSSAIVAFANCRRLDLSEEWLALAEKRGILVDIGTHISVLKTMAWRKGRDEVPLDDCETWVERNIEGRLDPTAELFRILIRAAMAQKLPERAEHWFVEARKAGFKPNHKMWSTLFEAVAFDPEITKQWFEKAANELEPDGNMYVAMIRSMATGGLADEAEGYYEQLTEKGIKPTTVTFHALMAAAAADVDRTLFWFEEMQDNGLNVTLASWDILLKSCHQGWLSTRKRA